MKFAWIALIQFVASWIAIRAALEVAQRWRLMDEPNARSMHQRPVPRLGGAAFGAVLLLGAGAWSMSSGVDARLLGAAIAAVGIYALGLLDDLLSLPSWARLLVQAALATLAVWPWAVWPGTPRELALAFWVLWVVGLTNAFNFMDGLDGLAGTQALVAGAFWFLATGTVGGTIVPVLGLCAGTAAAAFLIFNWPPARLFMGDAGSTLFGFLFALLPLLHVSEAGAAHRVVHWWLAAAFVLWPFLVDTSVTLVRRLIRGENILQAHRSHFYQTLARAGMPAARVTLIYGLAAIAGAGAAAALLSRRGAVVALGVAAAVAALALLTRGRRFTGHNQKEKPHG